MSDTTVYDLDITSLLNGLVARKPQDIENRQRLVDTYQLVRSLVDAAQQQKVSLENATLAPTTSLPQPIVDAYYAPLKETYSDNEQALADIEQVFGAISAVIDALTKAGFQLNFTPAENDTPERFNTCGGGCGNCCGI